MNRPGRQGAIKRPLNPLDCRCFIFSNRTILHRRPRPAICIARLPVGSLSFSAAILISFFTPTPPLVTTTRIGASWSEIRSTAKKLVRKKIGANFALFVLSAAVSPPAVSPLSQTVDEERGDRGAGGRDVGGFEGGVVEGELAIMGGLVWDDVGGQVTSPLIGLHSICQ